MGTTVTRVWCERNFNIYSPTGIGSNRPCLIVLHPGLSNALFFQTSRNNLYNVMNEVSDALDMFTVYPNGRGRIFGFNTWNASDSVDIYASHIKAKCSLFLKNLIKIMVDEYNVDPAKVYLFGFSNGGFLAYKYITERPDDIAGVISFASSLVKDFDECLIDIEVPITHVHGVNDISVPILGGEGNPKTYHKYKSLDTIEDFFLGRGADFTRINLPTGEHNFISLKTKLLSEANTDIYQLTENMIDPAIILEDFEELTGTGNLPENGPAGYAWDFFGGASSITSNTGLRTQGTKAALINSASLTAGIVTSGANLTSYDSIRLDVWAHSDGVTRLKVIDNLANSVSMDTVATTSDIYERHVLFLDLTTLVDLTECIIQISGFSPVVDCLRGV